MRYEIQNFRFGSCKKDPDTLLYSFFTAVVDLFTYEYFLWFKVNKKLEKDVPILCRCHLWPSFYETWIRADTGKSLHSAYSMPLYHEITKIRETQANEALLERYSSINDKEKTK